MINKAWNLTNISYEVRTLNREYVDYMPVEDPFEYNLN